MLRESKSLQASEDKLVETLQTVKFYVEDMSKKNRTEGADISCSVMLNDIARLYHQLTERDQAAFITELSRQARAIVPHTPNLKAARIKHLQKQTNDAFIPGSIGGVGAYVIPEILMKAASSSVEISLLSCCCKIGLRAFLGGAITSLLVGGHTLFNSHRYSAEQLGQYSSRFNQYHPYDEIQNKLGINLVPARAPASMSMS